MNAPQSSSSSTLSTLSPLEAARKIAPLVRENAGEIEKTRELPRPVFEAIADAGLFLLCVPKSLGGGEIDFPTQIRIAEVLGLADASTAWAVDQGMTFASFSAYMQPDAAREIWTNTPRSVVSNSPSPTAKAVAVPGGYRVTGRQPFSTGIKHASWVAAHAQVIENGVVRQHNGKPEARYCLIPKREVEVIDAWHTKGMRGTGTHTFDVKDVFVPEARTVFPRGAQLISPGPRYKIPVTLGFAAGDGMVALGLARNCLEAFYEVAGSKAPRNMTGLLREQSITQLAAGQAEAALRAGRAYLLSAAQEIWASAVATSEPVASLESRINLRLASTHAIRLAAQVVDGLHPLCGATVVFDGHLIQRLFNDMHVITQHSQGRFQHYEISGKYYTGLEIDEGRL